MCWVLQTQKTLRTILLTVSNTALSLLLTYKHLLASPSLGHAVLQRINIVCLKNKIQSSQKSIILKSETELFLKHIDKDEIIILLDEKGKEFSNSS